MTPPTPTEAEPAIVRKADREDRDSGDPFIIAALRDLLVRPIPRGRIAEINLVINQEADRTEALAYLDRLSASPAGSEPREPSAREQLIDKLMHELQFREHLRNAVRARAESAETQLAKRTVELQTLSGDIAVLLEKALRAPNWPETLAACHAAVERLQEKR